MKFSVGYKITDDDRFVNYIIQNSEKVYEVYFSWGDFPNGRNNQLMHKSYDPWQAQQRQIADLKRLSNAGLQLNLLLNGNCYGKYSLSRALFQKNGDAVSYIQNTFGLASVTTTSPVIAKFIKNNFEGLFWRKRFRSSLLSTC